MESRAGMEVRCDEEIGEKMVRQEKVLSRSVFSCFFVSSFSSGSG